MLHTELQEEEFQEADILWPDAAAVPKLPRAYYSLIIDDGDDGGDSSSGYRQQTKQQIHVQQKASSPIDIPGRKVAVGARGTQAPPAGLSKFGASHAGLLGGGSLVIGSHVFVPPHVIVDRRAKRDKAMMMMLGAAPSGRARARKTMRE